MKKILISESEKEEILGKHRSFISILQNKKNMVSEQVTQLTGDELITKAKQVCPTLKSGVFLDENGSKVLKIVASSDGPVSVVTNKPKYVTGDILIYKSNMTYDVYDGAKVANNDWVKKGSYKWKCAGLTAQSTEFKTTASQQEIKAGGWMTFDEAKAANINLTDPKFYDTKNINGVDYFRKKGISVGGAGSQEQTQVIDFLTNRYGTRFQRKLNQDSSGFCWAFQGEDPLVEPRWTLTDVVGGEEYGVKEGLKIFVSPECLKNVRNASKDVVKKETGFKSIDNRTCKDTLENYMDAYESNTDTSTTAFKQMRRDAQACKRKFCDKDVVKTQGKCNGNWNLGLFGGSRKMDDIIDFFSGKQNPIGTPEPRTSPWRIDTP